MTIDEFKARAKASLRSGIEAAHEITRPLFEGMTEEQRNIHRWQGYADDALDMFRARHKPYWIGDTVTSFRDQARNQIKICRSMPAEARKHFVAKGKRQ